MENLVVYLRNSEGKEWLIQNKYCKVGCSLYQPSAWKGKLVKKILPILLIFPATPCRMVSLHNFVPDNVLSFIHETFGNECNCSAFMGTPGTHKKATIQISKARNIIGYVKYSTDPIVQNLFKKEQEILTWLRKKEVLNVPECLAMQTLEDSTVVFVQSTKKTVNSKVEHQFGLKQKYFLDSLYEATKETLQFENTDFAKTIFYVQENIGLFNEKEKVVVEQAIKMIYDAYANSTVEFGACHRDFTPWNMCVTGNQLFVFDWEYSKKTYPSNIDQCHFLIQTKRFEKRLSVDMIAKEIKKNNYYNLGRLAFISYCLDNAAIYIQRNKTDDLIKAKEKIRLLEYIES